MSLMVPIDGARQIQLARIAQELGLKNNEEIVYAALDEFILNHPAPKTFEEKRQERQRQVQKERQTHILRDPSR